MSIRDVRRSRNVLRVVVDDILLRGRVFFERVVVATIIVLFITFFGVFVEWG